MPPPYPAELRHRAVELAHERAKPMAELAKNLRISETCLRNWLAQADADESSALPQIWPATRAAAVDKLHAPAHI